MNKVLIIEDDETIRSILENILVENNYIVETAEDGIMGLDLFNKSYPDLVILDLGLPKLTGESVCHEIKKRHPELPVIILTAKNQTADIVQGLNLGADDYISKPVEIEELLARIKVRLRHISQDMIQVGDLMLNAKTLEVNRASKKISLTPHEFKLLYYLMMNKGTVLSREMILNRVWQYSYDIDSRVVDVYVGYLRKKIDDGFDHKLLTSIRGFGYTIRE